MTTFNQAGPESFGLVPLASNTNRSGDGRCRPLLAGCGGEPREMIKFK